MKVNNKGVGQRIKNIRKSKGETQTEFADTVNATLPAVSNWETGRNIPNNKRLKQIAEIGNITVDQLLYGNSITFKELKKYVASIEGSKVAKDIDEKTVIEILELMKGKNK